MDLFAIATMRNCSTERELSTSGITAHDVGTLSSDRRNFVGAVILPGSSDVPTARNPRSRASARSIRQAMPTSLMPAVARESPEEIDAFDRKADRHVNIVTDELAGVDVPDAIDFGLEFSVTCRNADVERTQ